EVTSQTMTQNRTIESHGRDRRPANGQPTRDRCRGLAAPRAILSTRFRTLSFGPHFSCARGTLCGKELSAFLRQRNLTRNVALEIESTNALGRNSRFFL